MPRIQTNTPAAAVELLRGLIDYAGFFPPAGLPVAEALENYCRYQATDFHWMLGHLVLPVGKLPDLAQRLVVDRKAPLLVSAVMPTAADLGGYVAGLKTIRDFNEQHQLQALVNVIECRVDSRAELVAAQAAIDEQELELTCFWELPLQDSLPSLVEAIVELKQQTGQRGHHAKVRTGSIVPGAIPNVESVANFLALCARHQVTFKATAGLHHPLRSTHPLTYAADAPCDLMHGFLNMFLAATAASSGTTETSILTEILRTESPSEFQVETTGIRWRDLFWTLDQIRSARNNFANSFGSCSFTEPVHDLQVLGWLPASTESF